MKKSIHQILSDFFEEQNKRTNKMIEAESKQKAIWIMKTDKVKVKVCFN